MSLAKSQHLYQLMIHLDTRENLPQAMDLACCDIGVESCQGWIRHTRGFFFFFLPCCLARENIDCDVGEFLWPDPECNAEAEWIPFSILWCSVCNNCSAVSIRWLAVCVWPESSVWFRAQIRWFWSDCLIFARRLRGFVIAVCDFWILCSHRKTNLDKQRSG